MKKVKQIPSIFKDLENNLWWEYKEYQKQEIDMLEEWVKKNHKDFILTNDLFENIQYLAKTIGCYPHPVFRQIPEYLKEKDIEKHFQSEMPENGEADKDNNKYLLINNQRIDYMTLRFMQQAWQNSSNFTVIKFFNNNMQHKLKISNYTLFYQTILHISEAVNDQIIIFITNPLNKIIKLFYEWNPIENILYSRQFFAKMGSTSTLEFVVLRSNKIGDDTFIALINSMEANQNCNIKYLEFYDNQIGQESLDRLAKFMDTYNKFEYLGFAKNNITTATDIQELMKRIGKEKMTEQMLEAQSQKEKDREDLILKWNKVKKKYTEDMLPKLDVIVQLIDGSSAIMRNPQFLMLNLSMNNLSDTDLDYFVKFQHMFADDFQLVLWQNLFEVKAKEKLRKKLQKNVSI